jgi:hypothetical protein
MQQNSWYCTVNTKIYLFTMSMENNGYRIFAPILWQFGPRIEWLVKTILKQHIISPADTKQQQITSPLHKIMVVIY